MSAHQPYSATIWSEHEIWSRDQIATHQLDALKKQLRYVGDNSAFYKERFAAAGFDPREFRSFADLSKLPLTRKADYLAAMEAAPPWGTQIACAPEDIARVHFSSGTTGRPAHVCWTAVDIERWTDLFARYLYAQGVRKNDIYQVMYGFAWFVGGLAMTQAVQRIGAALIPAGNGDSKRQIETFLRYGTSVICTTPSFAAHLAEVAAEMGVDLRDTKIRAIGVGGEPGGSLPATRRLIESGWNAKMYDCYGMIEFQPTAWEVEAQDGLVLAEDFLYAEVIDAETREPVADGKPGVLVLTHLDKQACPLVRWWTGDMVIRSTKVGADGRTHARLVGGVQGRADDMLVIRGVNLFPSAVEEVIRSIPGVAGEYQIVLDRSVRDDAGFLTGFRLKLEADPAAPSNLNETVTANIRETLQVRCVVDVVALGALPRSMHKAKRVIHDD